MAGKRGRGREPSPDQIEAATNGERQFVQPDRERLARFDMDHIDELNAELMISAYLAATGQNPMTEDEREAMTKFKMQVKTAIDISDARRERLEVQELRELVEELRELKAYIERYGSSTGFQERDAKPPDDPDTESET